MGRNPGGRPPKFKDPEEMREIIEAYFERCRGHVMEDPTTGGPMLTKRGEPIYVDVHPPTMTGLARALGFRARQSLLTYKAKPRFEPVIADAMMRLEEYAEERLFDKDGAAGAKFSLQNNFRGWKNEADVSVNLSEGDDVMAEIRARLRDGDGDEP